MSLKTVIIEIPLPLVKFKLRFDLIQIPTSSLEWARIMDNAGYSADSLSFTKMGEIILLIY